VRDLELDVVRYRDGSVEILDEHEFEVARPRYPPNLVTLALEEASRLDSALRDATEPFNASPLRWLLTTAGLEPAVFAGVAG
jgi:protein associated with RNAse G/E